MSRPLDTIIDLQQALSELRRAEDQLAGIPDWMQELHEKHSQEKAEIQSLQETIEEAERERRASEAEVNDLRQKVRHFQDQISLVRNQREYGALLQEIDTAKAKLLELEEKVLEAMERQETTAKEKAEKQSSFQELDSRYSAELEKWEAQKPEVAHRAEQLRGRIQVLRERVPPQSLSLFDRIFEHYEGQALALIHRVDRGGKGPQIWHCGACNYRVRPQAVVAIHTKGSLENCDSCKRILYLDEESG